MGSSRWLGKAPVGRKRLGSGTDRGRRLWDAGMLAVAVADEMVVEDCDAPRAPIVPDDRVLGEAV